MVRLNYLIYFSLIYYNPARHDFLLETHLSAICFLTFSVRVQERRKKPFRFQRTARKNARAFTLTTKKQANRALFTEIKVLIINTSLRLRKIDLHLKIVSKALARQTLHFLTNATMTERATFSLISRHFNFNARGKTVSIQF